MRLLIPDREPTTDKSMGGPKGQLNDSISFILVPYRDMDEGLLVGKEITQR